MANFIKLTDSVNNVPVFINSDHIIAYGLEHEKSEYTTVLVNHAAQSLDVTETPVDIELALKGF